MQNDENISEQNTSNRYQDDNQLQCGSGANVPTSTRTQEIEIISDENEKENSDDDESFVSLPGNPQTWTATNIKTWLEWASKQFDLDPPLQPEKFPETGDDLLNLSKADFWVCASSKFGGNKLAKHIAYLQYNSTGIENTELTNDADPSK